MTMAKKQRAAGTSGDYFQHLRGDVLRHVPPDVRSALSIGCGAGLTEGELVKRGVAVTAIELDADAAAMARSRGVRVLQGDLHTVGTRLEGSTFGCLIYADILEHVPNPEAVLKQHLRYLVPGGTVIISVPNFRQYMVIWHLLVRGEIVYTDAGVFDRTHLRMTTRKMVLRWFSELGIQPERWKYGIRGRRRRFLSRLMGGLADEVLASQVLLVGRKRYLQA